MIASKDNRRSGDTPFFQRKRFLVIHRLLVAALESLMTLERLFLCVYLRRTGRLTTFFADAFF
jgi:hypothetical protein